ncbi:hypothetical protein F4X88_06630 [Candidatus Poribacteria bacterium]|nr:hypothetical protein [Candidatus Poribacteria bacterium]MYA55949.1 hypothetical protein [Candidatus Poribacteria bacterium]
MQVHAACPNCSSRYSVDDAQYR